MRGIFFEEEQARSAALALVRGGYQAEVVRERLAGEDDDEDHPWAVLTDAPEVQTRPARGDVRRLAGRRERRALHPGAAARAARGPEADQAAGVALSAPRRRTDPRRGPRLRRAAAGPPKAPRPAPRGRRGRP
ncbi:hypothetical protein G5V59_10700 [Nocardioides sp. W3-2-3]|uniref:hypothetical protein n=1 Tax=Nocardioides convexus TaxID=2712224 RepID=UPI00241853A7|nr:hypothetical protein [Nocardioides convexus]NHA00399.1 hypothetical protein [Nocardioides convexus]